MPEMYVSHPTAASDAAAEGEDKRREDKRSAEQKAWDLAATVCDPEIPVLTIADLGILRDVKLFDDGGMVPAVQVTITPTYSGCPAMDAIRDDLNAVFAKEGYPNVHVELVLSPAWTTDWMTESGKAKLQEYGIAPPTGRSGAARPPRPKPPTKAHTNPHWS